MYRVNIDCFMESVLEIEIEDIEEIFVISVNINSFKRNGFLINEKLFKK